MHTEDGIVWFHDRRRDLRARPHRERDLRLLTVIDREALEHEAAETGASAATARVVHQEALETGAVVRELTDAIEAQINLGSAALSVPNPALTIVAWKPTLYRRKTYPSIPQRLDGPREYSVILQFPSRSCNGRERSC